MSERVGTAEALRAAFDRSFALPPKYEVQAVEELLAIQIAGTPYALRAHEVVSLARARKVVPVPSAIAGLRGFVGLRGEVLPVYGLTELLGYASSAPNDAPWLAVCGTEERVCLAFDALDGYLKMPSASVYAAPSADDPAHVRHVARADAQTRAIVEVASVLATIRQRCDHGRALGEE